MNISQTDLKARWVYVVNLGLLDTGHFRSVYPSKGLCSLRSKRFRLVSEQQKPRSKIFGFGRDKNGTRAKKWKREMKFP